ncbi:FKBP-type peptidyl-prolyl cis-trans isomerase [Halosquirtibacter xylanolyticus]|uniref:FKBP-type peptidyl-prolyl cis-trans isomerase n=1 Tax=Halosquirtibacter xylanolyticus TaxID=3374599 RepID=UPI0037498C16|nr:FKBP-type peptidyl-prolyl cis-trans isomerase [Prolixibacteraceae bacterium]
MSIVKDKKVTLTYDLRVESFDADIYESATAENPLQFIYGAGQMLPAFETAIAGLEAGAEFRIQLSIEDAYGDVNEEAVVDLPKSIFEAEGKFDDEKIKVGEMIPMMTSDGRRMTGIVLEVSEETVKMDFNHPLAGEELFFQGKIVSVEEPTVEELQAVYSPAGGCGCGSGGCDSGSCGDDQEGGCGSGCGC